MCDFQFLKVYMLVCFHLGVLEYCVDNEMQIKSKR